MKNRLKKLESAIIGDEVDVFVHHWMYENKEGGIDSEVKFATLRWGDRSASAGSDGDESIEEFEQRLEGYKSLSWEEAQQEPGLDTSDWERQRSQERR